MRGVKTMNKHEVLQTLQEVDDLIAKIRICMNRGNYSLLDQLLEDKQKTPYTIPSLHGRVNKMLQSARKNH